MLHRYFVWVNIMYTDTKTRAIFKWDIKSHAKYPFANASASINTVWKHAKNIKHVKEKEITTDWSCLAQYGGSGQWSVAVDTISWKDCQRYTCKSWNNLLVKQAAWKRNYLYWRVTGTNKELESGELKISTQPAKVIVYTVEKPQIKYFVQN